MLRTIFIRSNLIKGSFRRAIRGNSRTLSIQVSKIRHLNRVLLKPDSHKPWQYKILRNYSSNLPEHIKVTLPALSPTMEVGTIVSWAKKEGDKLSEGDLLAEIETDKATMGFETPEEGYLAKILIAAGTKNVPVGKLVCVIVSNEGDVAAFKDFKDDSSAAPSAPTPAASAPTPTATPTASPPATSPSPVSAPPSAPTGRVYASPMAKRLAEQHNIRLQGTGSGLFNSITSKDLDKLGTSAGAPAASSVGAAPKRPAPQPAAGATYVDLPVSNIRGVIAKRLLESKLSVPHYYVSVDINVDTIMKIRATYNKKFEKEKIRLSVNDFIIKAAAMACKKVPEANSAWHGEFIREYNDVDISIAVSTDKGLLTPIVFQANNKGVTQINAEVKALAAKAREGKLQPHEFQGGTFSISNLGMFGVTNFCAIINPPQSCILAIGTTQKSLVLDEKSEKGFKSSEHMTVTLSADHRVVDGAVAAQWLTAFKNNLEDPIAMII